MLGTSGHSLLAKQVAQEGVEVGLVALGGTEGVLIFERT